MPRLWVVPQPRGTRSTLAWPAVTHSTSGAVTGSNVRLGTFKNSPLSHRSDRLDLTLQPSSPWFDKLQHHHSTSDYNNSVQLPTGTFIQSIPNDTCAPNPARVKNPSLWDWRSWSHSWLWRVVSIPVSSIWLVDSGGVEKYLLVWWTFSDRPRDNKVVLAVR